jgi:hypothetical protein
MSKKDLEQELARKAYRSQSKKRKQQKEVLTLEDSFDGLDERTELLVRKQLKFDKNKKLW